MTRTIRHLLVLALIVVATTAAPVVAHHPTNQRSIEEGEVDEGEVEEGEYADLIDDEFINVPEDLGPGTCTPDEVMVEQVVTCSFEILGNAAELDEFLDLHAVVVGNEQAASSRCVVDGRTLVCPDLLAPYDQGPFGVTVFPVSDGEPLASATVTRTVDGVLGLVLAYRRVPTVFSGVETTIGTFRSFALTDDEEAELLLRRDGEDEVVARVPALPANADEGVAVLTFPEAGRWTIAGCVAEPDGTCRVEGIRRPIHAIDPTPIPLLPDHNGPPEDRINLVFAGSGFGPGDDLPGTAIELLGIHGEPNQIEIANEIFDLDWGPFSIEPLRDEIDRFNFWYLADDVPSGSIVISPELDLPNPQVRIDDLGLGTGVSIVTIGRNGYADGSRANAELVSFADDERLPERSQIRFGSAYLPIDAGSWTAATTLAHELGHSLFGLRDEYEEFAEFGAIEALVGRPNCAASTEEAEELWGPLVGELDPMFTRWRDAMVENDIWFESDDAADDFTVGFVPGGCFGPLDGDGAVRPTVRGLMNGEEPVLGAVNRQRVEAVLDLFPEPPPPPPSTTAPTSAATTAETPTTRAEIDVASAPTDGGPPTGWLLAVAGLGATIVAGAALAVGRRRRRPGEAV